MTRTKLRELLVTFKSLVVRRWRLSPGTEISYPDMAPCREWVLRPPADRIFTAQPAVGCTGKVAPCRTTAPRYGNVGSNPLPGAGLADTHLRVYLRALKGLLPHSSLKTRHKINRLWVKQIGYRFKTEISRGIFICQ